MSGLSGTGMFAESEMDRQLRGLLGEITAKVDDSLKQFDRKWNEKIAGAVRDIELLSSDVTRDKRNAAQRMAALSDHFRKGGDSRMFACRQDAENFGLHVAAVFKKGKSILEKAGITPYSGPSGGYFMQEEYIQGIIRNVAQHGVFERNSPAIPVSNASGKSLKRASGPTVYYPNYGVAATASTPQAARLNYELKRSTIAIEIDNWMLESDSMAALGEFVAEEIAWGLRRDNDRCWFMGDGTSAYNGYTGLFKRPDIAVDADNGVLRVTGDAGDDTFAEIISKGVSYLGTMLGTAPEWVHSGEPKFYMHLLNFFKFLSVSDSTNRPIAQILQSENKPALYLMGYPVEAVQVAPSTTAVSTPFVVFSDLRRAAAVYRHKRAVFFKSSDQVKWLEAETVVAADVPQDMLFVDGNGAVQLATADA